MTKQHCSTRRKPSRRDPHLDVWHRMCEIAATRVRYGYRRIHVLLRCEGWALGRNVVWRLYWKEGLALRIKRRGRRKMVVQREARCVPTRSNEAWCLDFIHDQLTEEAITAGKAEPRTTQGGQPRYSGLAITTALMLYAVSHLSLRQTEGAIGSIIALLGLDLALPDHSTLSRRAETLAVTRPVPHHESNRTRNQS